MTWTTKPTETGWYYVRGEGVRYIGNLHTDAIHLQEREYFGPYEEEYDARSDGLPYLTMTKGVS